MDGSLHGAGRRETQRRRERREKEMQPIFNKAASPFFEFGVIAEKSARHRIEVGGGQ
jgi:hypothetical protein